MYEILFFIDKLEWMFYTFGLYKKKEIVFRITSIKCRCVQGG